MTGDETPGKRLAKGVEEMTAIMAARFHTDGETFAVSGLIAEVRRLRAALAERDAEVAGLRALVKRVPGALNAAFSAGTEECERGSARRQAREMEKVDALREDVRVALSASPAPAQGVTITDEMVERAAIAWCSVAGVPFEMTMRSVTLESARAALAAALVGRDDGWQSVETAPHDEDVLLYCPECGFASPAHVEVGPYSTGWRRDGYSTMSYHARATHWRPLPEPPLTPAPQEDTDRG